MTQDLVIGKIKISTLLTFAFGTVFLLITLVVRLAFPVSSNAEIAVQVPTALAAAAITAGIPGLFRFSASSPGKALTIRATGSLLVFLIVLALHSSRAQTVALIEGTLIFFTPLLIRHTLRKYRIRIGKPSLVLLSILMVVGEAAFFSETTATRLPDLPSNQVVQRGDSAGYDLINSKDCKSCYQHLWVRENTRFTKQDADSLSHHPRLDMQLEIEWRRWGQIPLLERNYQGRAHFTVDYVCNGSQADIYGSRLIGYSLKPGKIVLSWLIGFAEIPFLLDDGMVNGEIEHLVQERLSPCP
jgi:hypothetical protein